MIMFLVFASSCLSWDTWRSSCRAFERISWLHLRSWIGKGDQNKYKGDGMAIGLDDSR